MCLGEGLFIFRELRSTDYYFREAAEQAHTLTAKKLRKQFQGFGENGALFF